MKNTSTSTPDRKLIFHPLPINGDVHAARAEDMTPMPQAVEYQVARRHCFHLDGMAFEEGDEVVIDRDVTAEEMQQLVRAGVVLHERDAAARAMAARFNPANHTHQNVTKNAFTSARGYILPGAFCSAADFTVPGRPAEVIEESRQLVRLTDRDLRPFGDHTHFEVIRPRRESPAVPATDGVKVLEDHTAAGRIVPIPEWTLARWREEQAARAAREEAREAMRSEHAASERSTRTKAAS